MANIYDGAFRTILNDCRKMIIPVINEIFGETYTGEEEIRFFHEMEETMKPIPLSTVVKLTVIFNVIDILLLIIGICIGLNAVGVIFIMTAVIVSIGNIIFLAIFLRCPYCEGSLPSIWYRNHYCPHCGKYLT